MTDQTEHNSTHSNINEVTIYQIAEALNISASTVSRGLRNHPSIRQETREKIIKTAEKMGYQRNTFASSLRKKKTNTIGVVVPRLDSYFMSTVIAGIEKVVNENGYNLIISQSQETFSRETAAISTLFASRVDGLLISLAYDTRDMNHFGLLFRKGIPVIFFDRVFTCPPCTSIVIDNFSAGYDACKHLINQGCKNIIHLSGNLLRNVYSERFGGYKKALEEHGIQFNDDWLIVDELNEEAGLRTAKKIIDMKVRPDGIFTANDTSAVAVITGLKKAGFKIPDDIAVVGFNNDPLSRVVEPNLTTVNYPGEEMGELAASTLIDRLNNKKPFSLNTLVLHHQLIVRESSLRNPG